MRDKHHREALGNALANRATFRIYCGGRVVRCSLSAVHHLASIVVPGAAELFEMLQVQELSRHGRVFDAAVTMAGGVIGLSTGWLFVQFAMPR